MMRSRYGKEKERGFYTYWMAAAAPGRDALLGDALLSAPLAREPFFDNVKGLFLLLVLAVHLHLAFPCELPGFKGVESILLLAVMPGFCFVSGHLSCASPHKRERMVRLLKLAALLLLWQTIYILHTKLGANAAIALLPLLRPTANSTATNSSTAARLERIAETPWVPFAIWSTPEVTWFLLCLLVWCAHFIPH